MQTSKLILVICAFTLLTGVSLLGANDTEAQKKAREALRRQMQGSEGQPQPAAPSAPAATTPPVIAPAAQPPPPPATQPPLQPATQPPLQPAAQPPLQPAAQPPLQPAAQPPATPPATTPATPIAAPQSPDNNTQARARQALRQKMNEGEIQQPAAPAAFAAPSATAILSPTVADSPAQAKARETLWQKMRELDAHQPVAPPIATPIEPSFQPAVAVKPIDPVPSAFSGSTAGKLAELLRQYRADQITPEDYHKQRAAILAEK